MKTKNQKTQSDYEAIHEELFKASRQRRLQNPSAGERAVMQALKALMVTPEREYRLGKSLYTVGFFCAEVNLAIEMAGAPAPRDFKRRDWSQRKDALCGALGIKLIRVQGTDVGVLICLIREAIGYVEEKAA